MLPKVKAEIKNMTILSFHAFNVTTSCLFMHLMFVPFETGSVK